MNAYLTGSSSPLRTGKVTLDIDKYQVALDGKQVQLAWMEFQLLKFLMQNPGRIFTREQLLSRVWGAEDIGRHSNRGRAHPAPTPQTWCLWGRAFQDCQKRRVWAFRTPVDAPLVTHCSRGIHPSVLLPIFLCNQCHICSIATPKGKGHWQLLMKQTQNTHLAPCDYPLSLLRLPVRDASFRHARNGNSRRQ